MHPSIEQLKHNEKFLDSICDTYSDQFYDWKITCLFYCAYHLVQALAAHRNVFIGDRHHVILRNLNPKTANRPLQFKDAAFDAYDNLFEYCQTARYRGFTSFEDFQIMKKADFEDSKKRYNWLKKYVLSQGVVL